MQPGDFFSLVIQASITLAGFTGIVVVLGRRQVGEWTPTDRVQFRALINTSVSPLTLSGVGLVLLAAELPLETVWRVWGLISFGLFLISLTAGIRFARKFIPAAEIRRTTGLVVLTGATVTSVLVLVNAITWAQFWPIALQLTFMIGVAVFNFIQLLWRAVFQSDA